jgi:hypothetical protein
MSKAPKQIKIALTAELYPDIPDVIEEIRTLTGTVTSSQITADALRAYRDAAVLQKKREARRDGKDI